MALSDTYSQRMWSPNEEVNQRIDQGLGTAAQAYQTQQQSYSTPFKRALEQMMADPSADPVALAQATKQQLAQTQAPTPSAFPGQGEQGPMDIGRAMPSAGQGFATQMPQPMSAQTFNMGRTVMRPGAGDQTGMQRPAQAAFPEPQRAPAPQAQGPMDGALRTDADVRGALSTMPYVLTRKTQVRPQRDYMGEIRERGNQSRITEGVRQDGRVMLMDVRNGQRQLESAVRDAYNRDMLDERDAHHAEVIRLGYARLATLEHLLDKNIDYKRTSGSDEMLKTARTVVDSLTASEAGLIGSAFASTPEGQRALQQLRGTLQTWTAKLQEYAGGETPAIPTTNTTEVHQSRGGMGTRTPGTVKPPSGPAQSGTIRVRRKADGQTGNLPASQFDPAKYDKI